MLQPNSIQKIIQNNLFLTNSIQNSNQNFEIGCIQFNKIFIQLENVGIEQGYSRMIDKSAEELKCWVICKGPPNRPMVTLPPCPPKA